VGAAFEAFYNHGGLPAPPLGYTLLCLALPVVVAFALSALAPALGATTLAALWAFLYTAILWKIPLHHLFASASALGPLLVVGAVIAAGRVEPGLWSRGASSGAILGGTLALASGLWPALQWRLRDVVALQGVLDPIGWGLVFLGVLGGLLVAERLRSGSGAPLALLLAAVLAFASMDEPAKEASIAFPEPSAVEAPSRPSVLLLVLDTVRADHLSLYGYERETSPSLQRWSHQENVRVYSQAYSTAPWTGPAHASLFTGEISSHHGANLATYDLAHNRGATLRSARTLAETLSARGYRSAAVLANRGIWWVDGIQRGFDVFMRPAVTRGSALLGEGLRESLLPFAFDYRILPYPDARAVNRDVLRAIDAAKAAPFFVVANYMDAHTPYAPPPPFRGRFSGREWARLAGPALPDQDAATHQRIAARYDEELASLDASLGDLLAELRLRQGYDSWWIFITADHGEAFGEHGVTEHGGSLYDEQIHIPLLVRPPRGTHLPAPGGPVSLIDLTRTISRIAGGPALGEGRDLRALPRDHAVVSEFFGEQRLFRRKRNGEAVRFPARAVVRHQGKLMEKNGALERYNLSSDPEERTPLPGPPDPALIELLPPLRAEPDENTAPTLTPKEKETLRALGYVE